MYLEYLLLANVYLFDKKMISPTKVSARSPLKATDANSRQPLPNLLNADNSDINNMTKINTLASGSAILKKRSLERLEQQQQQERKKTKIERSRSIEGAVIQTSKNALMKITDQQQQTQQQQIQQQSKVSPNELLEWQNNWKKIMRRESRIYFDTTDENDVNKYAKNKLDKKKEHLKNGFASLGAQITQFFDTSVTIVITRRSIDKINLLQETDVLSRAKKNYMKVWGYDKSTRFLKNLDVDFDQLEKTKINSLAAPTLSNLLQNEKLYGPTDRDPRTRRDDIHYFKFPFVYMYDQWQTWAPIIVLEWKPQELSDINNLPYPILKCGTFGRCPFIGDGSCDELAYKRVVKRYNRDKGNRSYALRLRQLYQYHSEPSTDATEFIVIPHACLDSKQSYNKWQIKLTNSQSLTKLTTLSNNGKITEQTTRKPENEHIEDVRNWKEPSKIQNKTLAHPSLSQQQLLGTMVRQETEEFPNDLCNSKNVTRIPQEIKASGVHQSNDVATSFGNGLGPTKASVMSKNIKSLSRLVVDRRLGTKPSTSNTTGKSVFSKPLENTTAQITKDAAETITKNEAEVNVEEVNENKTSNQLIKNTTDKPSVIKKETEKVVNAATVARNSGYCENCRIKYDSLDLHIRSERHQSFAQNDLNFEIIDSLISKLKFQF